MPGGEGGKNGRGCLRRRETPAPAGVQCHTMPTADDTVQRRLARERGWQVASGRDHHPSLHVLHHVVQCVKLLPHAGQINAGRAPCPKWCKIKMAESQAAGVPREPEPPTPDDVVAAMSECEPYTAAEIVELVDAETSRWTVQRRLESLVDDGRVERKEHEENRVSYWLPAEDLISPK